MTQPILIAWIYDSDAVGFAVYQSGKAVTEHIMNPDGYSKMGNIALFCETLDLPAEDAPRLRSVWKKGDAEEQLALTDQLLGLPLYHDAKTLPEERYSRDSDTVDTWIAERPTLPKVKSETKAVFIQELTYFCQDSSGTQFDIIKPYWYAYEFLFDGSYQFWEQNTDGTLRLGWVTKNLLFQTSQDRVLGIDKRTRSIVFDSAGLLPEGYEIKGATRHIRVQYFLSDGGLLWKDYTERDSGGAVLSLFIRCAPDGAEMWRKSGDPSGCPLFTGETYKNSEFIFSSYSGATDWVERVDVYTGNTIEKQPRPFGLNARPHAYHNGCWWIAHDRIVRKDGKRENWENRGYALTKFSDSLQPLAESVLPLYYTQELFFSPDNVYVYVFFFKDQVMVLNSETLAVENILTDKSFLMPRGFDSAGRFWIQRDNSMIEAWDACLGRTLSRHRLKGRIVGHHQNEQGALCVAALSEKQKVLRVYKLE